jgi:hypothetical protein
MRAGIEVVHAALVGRQPRGDHAVERRQQRRRTVDHSGVDDLAPARPTRFEDAADEPESEIQRAAGEIADQVQGRGRRPAAAAKGMKRADERDVVDVVPGGLRERPLLAPAGDAAVDEAGVARQAILRAKAEPLGDAPGCRRASRSPRRQA